MAAIFAYHSNAGLLGREHFDDPCHRPLERGWAGSSIATTRACQRPPDCAQDCYSGTNCFMSTPPSGFFTNVITAGTPVEQSWNAKLDNVAIQIRAMAAANMPVILALLHETQSNGWFWWAKTTSATDFNQPVEVYFQLSDRGPRASTTSSGSCPTAAVRLPPSTRVKAYVDIGGGDYLRDQSTVHVPLQLLSQHHGHYHAAHAA